MYKSERYGRNKSVAINLQINTAKQTITHRKNLLKLWPNEEVFIYIISAIIQSEVRSRIKLVLGVL